MSQLNGSRPLAFICRALESSSVDEQIKYGYAPYREFMRNIVRAPGLRGPGGVGAGVEPLYEQIVELRAARETGKRMRDGGLVVSMQVDDFPAGLLKKVATQLGVSATGNRTALLAARRAIGQGTVHIDFNLLTEPLEVQTRADE